MPALRWEPSGRCASEGRGQKLPASGLCEHDNALRNEQEGTSDAGVNPPAADCAKKGTHGWVSHSIQQVLPLAQQHCDGKVNAPDKVGANAGAK